MSRSEMSRNVQDYLDSTIVASTSKISIIEPPCFDLNDVSVKHPLKKRSGGQRVKGVYNSPQTMPGNETLELEEGC